MHMHNFEIAQKCCMISKLHESPCTISKLLSNVAQFGDFQVAQRNFEIAQIYKMRNIYISDWEKVEDSHYISTGDHFRVAQ